MTKPISKNTRIPETWETIWGQVMDEWAKAVNFRAEQSYKYTRVRFKVSFSQLK